MHTKNEKLGNSMFFVREAVCGRLGEYKRLTGKKK